MLDPDRYHEHLALEGLADSTIRVYSALYRRWLDWAATEGHPPEPSAVGVRRWSEASIPPTASSRAACKAAIHHLCTASGVEDVSTVVRTLRDPRRGKTPRLRPEQVTRLVATIPSAGLAGLAVAVGLYTGARRSEIATLRWDRIDFATATVTLWRPKGRDLLAVPLHPRLGRMLADRDGAGGDWVFAGRHGGHASYAQVGIWVGQVGRQAGAGKVAPHQLRVEFGARTYAASKDLRAVQDLLGHADPRTTSLYARVADDRLAEVVAGLDYLEAAVSAA